MDPLSERREKSPDLPDQESLQLRAVYSKWETEELLQAVTTKRKDYREIGILAMEAELTARGVPLPTVIKKETPVLSPPMTDLCKKCNVNPGDTYHFWYGTKLDSYSPDYFKSANHTVITNYKLGGHRSVSICSQCLFNARLFELLWAIILIVITPIYFLLINYFTSRPLSGWLILLFFIFGCLSLLGLQVLTSLPIGKQNAGDREAISLGSDGLGDKGFDTFWTTEEYMNLRTKGGLK